MSQDSENSDNSNANLPGSEEKKPGFGNPLFINAIIFGVYSLFALFAAVKDADGDSWGVAFGYAMFIALHVIINLLLFLIFIFIDGRRAALCLLSSFSIAIIGFSACAGMGSLSSGHRKTPMERREEQVKLDSTMKAETDSLRKSNIRSKRIKDSTDSVSRVNLIKDK